jgi:GrpB-like predicted nucleotidyltransferase (UPF0157 family)
MVTIVLEPHSPQWPIYFSAEEQRIRQALAGLAIDVHHTGSTSVPGLRAKPIIDITLAVPDSTDEDAYLPALVDAGYEFLLREPHWLEHRLFRRVDPRVNLHVFTTGSDEIDRMLAFRDHLRTDDADRDLYESTKAELADVEWQNVQDYADAKSMVIETILARAQRSSRCESCGFTYELTSAQLAGHHITIEAESLAAIIEAGAPGLTRRPAPDTWSALEYACHTRDVLMVQRERVLLARRTRQPPLVPMGRDDRVEHDGYNLQSPEAVARQLRDAAALFAGVLARLDDEGWIRTVIYNFPAPAVRTLAWVAVHTHHEVVHHLADVRAQLTDLEED